MIDDARVFIANRLQVQLILQQGHAVHCARWKYTYKHGEAQALLLRYDISPMVKHQFETITDMIDDIQIECSGKWNEVSYYVKGVVE